MIFVIAGLVVFGILVTLGLFANMNSSQISKDYGPYEQPIKTK